MPKRRELEPWEQNLVSAIKEQRKQLQAIRAHLDRLEDGGSQVIDV